MQLNLSSFSKSKNILRQLQTTYRTTFFFNPTDNSSVANMRMRVHVYTCAKFTKSGRYIVLGIVFKQHFFTGKMN